MAAARRLRLPMDMQLSSLSFPRLNCFFSLVFLHSVLLDWLVRDLAVVSTKEGDKGWINSCTNIIGYDRKRLHEREKGKK